MTNERLYTEYRNRNPILPVLRQNRMFSEEAPGTYVTGVVNYQMPSDRKPAVYVSPPGTGEHRRTSSYKAVSVPIYDGRVIAADLSLDRQGFALRRHNSAVTDFYDDEQVLERYYPEMEQMVKQATGASRVVVFDHTTRVDGGANTGNNRAPVRIVHNDYTANSAPRRVHDLLPDEANDLLRRRFAVINVWRPIQGPVRKAPLAVIDAQSVAGDDLVATDLVYQDRTGEIYEVSANEAHRWFYFPLMEHDEVLLIKGYDSLADGRARFTPHTAFDDPSSAAGAPARESIEIRTLVFFE